MDPGSLSTRPCAAPAARARPTLSSMATLEDMTSSGEVALLDRRVLALLASTLDGQWRPDDEDDPERRALAVAAGRLRVYGDRQRSGWLLLASAADREGLDTGAGAWSVGFLPTVDAFDDTATPADVAGQASLLGDEVDGAVAGTLAWALLTSAVTLVVTTDPRDYRHTRSHDLPERLAVIGLEEAVERLGIAPGEVPFADLPTELAALGEDGWWVPR